MTELFVRRIIVYIFLAVLLIYLPFLLKDGRVEEARFADTTQYRKVNVILANFSDAQDQPWSKAEINSKIFAETNSINSFYKENSYGKTGLSGQVYGWYQLPVKQTCDADSVFDEALKLAKNELGFDDSGDTLSVVIAPFGPTYCGWVGYSLGYRRIAAVVSSNPNFLVTVAHELGHGFGLLHASFYDCKDFRAENESCSVEEYGDLYDVMGSSVAPLVHFNAVHKEFMGWFDGDDQKTVAASGQYDLLPIASAEAGLKSIKIRRSENQYIYLEYRQPIGFDRNLKNGGENVYDGVILHLAPNFSSKSFLINPSEPNQSYNPVLALNKRFVDPVSGVAIEPVAKNAKTLSVRVTMPGDMKSESLKQGRFGSGSLVLDRGVIYQISGREKLGFTTLSVFNGLGYSLKNVLTANTDNYAVSKFSPIASAKASHPPGSWVLSGKTVYYRHFSGMVPVPSWENFLSNGGQKELLVKANAEDAALIRQSGQLLPLGTMDERVQE